MTWAAEQQQEIIEHTRRSFPDDYSSLRFPTSDEAGAALLRRDATLSELAAETKQCCGGTKIFTGPLPAGCSLCAHGSWCCLHINSTCNAICFFCPKPKTQQNMPTADGLIFSTVTEFVEYLQAVGSQGVGISGGEPLLELDRTIEYIEGVKTEFGDRFHVWLYSNGLLATEMSLRDLRAAGLDEIRFNIAADKYGLEAVRLAAGVFDTVVVEIPGVPEDSEKLKDLLPELADLGVKSLNLHQLWCSNHSAASLAVRPYTFLHGSRVSVLESELMVLETLVHATDAAITLPIHYCSAIFKHRYQTAAALRRDADIIAQDCENVTEAGLIRRLSLCGTPSALTTQNGAFELAGAPPTDYHLAEEEGRLHFNTRLWNLVDFAGVSVRLQYDLAHRIAENEPNDSITEIPIGVNRSLRMQRSPVMILPALSSSEIRTFESQVIHHGGAPEKPTTTALGPATKLDQFERIETGWPDYF